jgi:hypothetical protein
MYTMNGKDKKCMVFNGMMHHDLIEAMLYLSSSIGALTLQGLAGFKLAL